MADRGFTFRFIVQWIHAEATKQSVLSGGFWVIGVVGSGMIAIHAAFRRDPVLLVANLGGCVISARNLALGARARGRRAPRTSVA